MRMNPVAIEWWAFCGAVAFAIVPTGQALAIGLAFGLGVSLVWDFWPK